MGWNCGAGEDSQESLGLQGGQTSQSERKSTLFIHWQDWCWSWSFKWLIGKNPDAGKDWRQKEMRVAKNETVRQHHWLNEQEFEQTPGGSRGQGSWCAAVYGVSKNYIGLSKGTKSQTRLSDFTFTFTLAAEQSKLEDKNTFYFKDQ